MASETLMITEKNVPPEPVHIVGSKTDNCNKRKRLRLLIILIFTSVVLVLFVVFLVLFILCQTGKFTPGKEGEMTSITVDVFGTTSKGEEVKRFKLLNHKTKMEAEVMTYGGTLTVLKVPDNTGQLRDVTLGFDTLQGYEGPDNPYFGALVGRYANRIGNASFTYCGEEYHLTANDGINQLHGGTVGWNKAVWKGSVEDNSLILSHTSPDGDQGYPGSVTATVTIDLTNEGELRLQYKATASDKVTPINLTSHPYFNLNGEGSGEIYDHEVTLFADKYTPVSDTVIPTGEIASVENTIFDLRQTKALGDVLNSVPGGGYDHNFCLNGPTGRKQAARVSSAKSGILMEVFTDQPGVQFYTANGLDLSEAKNGHVYPKHSAFCLETQNYPDAPNKENFPDSFLAPGSEYRHTVWYKFSTQ